MPIDLHIEEDVRDLRDRMTRVETLITSLVTREDLANFRISVERLEEAAKNFETLSSSVATKSDVDWIKNFVRWALGIIGSLIALLAGVLLNHVIHP